MLYIVTCWLSLLLLLFFSFTHICLVWSPYVFRTFLSGPKGSGNFCLMCPLPQLASIGVLPRGQPRAVDPETISELWFREGGECRVCDNVVRGKRFRQKCVHIAQHIGLCVCLNCFSPLKSFETADKHAREMHNRHLADMRNLDVVQVGRFFVGPEQLEEFLTFGWANGMRQADEVRIRHAFAEAIFRVPATPQIRLLRLNAIPND